MSPPGDRRRSGRSHWTPQNGRQRPVRQPVGWIYSERMPSDSTRGPSGTRGLGAATLVKVPRLRVSVSRGRDSGAAVQLDDAPVVIGTSAECDLVLTDDTVSARHCELSMDGGRLVLRDLGSTNGVRLGGVRVREAFPEPGTTLELGQTQLVLEAEADEERVVSRRTEFGRLFGQSAAMRAVFAALESVAHSDAPLLIEGETGTGKDLTAEAVHQASPRRDGPFVLFDCGAVAANLIESELFGFEKGAFTGATQHRTGLAFEANGGTLVLDEIGELPLELQPKLLRLVERREVRRVGANAPETVDVRIIACTNRSLRGEVKAERFRQDLYFRLAALRVRLPALRERTEDIPGIVDRMLGEQGATRRFADLSEADQTLLLQHPWPGNARELRNVVDRLLAFPTSGAMPLIDEDEAAAAVTPREPAAPLKPLAVAREQAQDAFERAYLGRLMKEADGSISEAARRAEVSRQFIQRLLRKHGLR